MNLQRFIPSSSDLNIDTNIVSPSVAILISKSFDALKAGNYTLAEKFSRIAMDVTWEHLNIGHWKDIHDQWRKTYSLSALCQSLSLIFRNERTDNNNSETSASSDDMKEAIRLCDMGIIMGFPIGENILSDLATEIHRHLSASEPGYPKVSADQHLVSKRRRKIEQVPLISPECCIAKLASPTLERFQLDFSWKRRPCVITNAIDHWPALKKWSLEYICNMAGYRTVPVEIGSKYTEDTWSQKLMTINDYVGRFLGDDASEIGYLAQHRLFDQIKELRDDIVIPDYCFCCTSESASCSVNEDDVDINAWFGPRGTISPLHYDPRDNLLAQVIGRKYIRLYSPSETNSLYPHEGMLQNTSMVDVENVDREEYPKFKDASYLECILEPGEMLYIPQKWWHYVRSLETSFSVSFWFGDELPVP